MSTLQEIKTAIAGLSEHDKTLLTAELFAEQAAAPDDERLARSLQRGLEDARAGRVQPLDAVAPLIHGWTTKS